MQNNAIVVNIVRFITLVLVQVLILNHINLAGYINPYLYPLFILVFPLTGNKSLLILISFFLGLTIDMFGDSGGVHAAACIFIAWIRPVALKYSFGVSYQLNTLKISTAPFTQQLIYIFAMVLLHHLMLFSMEIFNVNQILLVLKSTLFSGIFSAILMVFSILLFSRKSS
ncbi:rod shape-determining protein MreD [Aureisphaera galaxeae]|uniref:rod shape-determining protein MreD n=1 Tax=Aureisphaera galaxeae TaxID=1538023 RepID=UPI00234FEC06|nr:rod shape-determining protein MreD [Aureisphaera galaxeae]MDC8003044.1 rod shape-determining protein MreD [Aureisphaera galaxeae]